MSIQRLKRISNFPLHNFAVAWPRTIRIVAISLAALIFGSFLPAYGATVTITAHAGGIRSGATTVAGLPNGAVFTAVAVSGSPAGGPFTCTTSSGTGSCAISVPSGFAWNVSLTSAPTNYYLSPSLGYGSASSVTPDTYQFRTGTVNSNIDVPGSSATGTYNDIRHSGNNYFSGLLAASYDNQPVSQKCGLNVALLLDQSGSMSGTKQTSLKQAANDTIDALVGTPSNLAIYTFSSSTGPSIAKTSTASSASAQPLRNFVNGLSTPSGSTNWDSGINQIPSGFDLVIFATDGNPTTYDSNAGSGSGSYFQYVEQGVFSSNRLKSTGVRVVGVGIGLDGGQENLRAVSGATLNSDYYLASTSGFGEILKSLATGACNNQLSIQKIIQDPSGNPLADSPLANGWEYSNTISAGSTIDTSVTTGQVNDQNGFASATVTIPAGATPTISVTETLKSGYVLQDAECSVEGLPVNTTVVGNVATFTAKANVPMSCVFTNRALATNWSLVKTSDPASGSDVQPGDTITYTLNATNSSDFAITSATATDDISNIVDDATLGTLPAGLTRISNTLTWSIGTIAANSSKQVSYTATVNQNAVNATLTNVATPGNSGQCPTTADCTTTHKTPAVGFLTLVKDVNNGQSGGTKTPADWTLSADGGSGGSQIVNSPTGVLHEVIPSTYTLSESVQQVGYTTDGIWACTGQDSQTGQPSANVVVVGVGEQVICTITNSATDPSWIISKTSNPGSGSTVLPGQTISYTVTLSHVGGVMPANTVVSDDLSSVLANASLGPIFTSSGSASLVGSVLTWNSGSFVGSATLTYSVIVAADAYGVTLSNVVTPPKNGVCDPSCESTLYTPHYTINKTSDPADGSLVSPGDVVTYTLHAVNDSDAVVAGAVVTDSLVSALDNASLSGSLPAGLVLVGSTLSWSVPTLASGASASVSYSVQVNANAYGQHLVNVVTPDATGDCPLVRSVLVCSVDLHTADLAHLTLVKRVVNGQTGGTMTSSDWLLSADGGTASMVVDSASGVRHEVLAGTYSLSESAQPLGYTSDGVWSCVGVGQFDGQVSDNSVELVPGDDVTCTITNTATDSVWKVAKSSDPVSGSTVVPGQLVNYTVTLSHVGGVMPANTVVSDDLSNVLANASLGPIFTSSGSASMVGSVLTWNSGSFVGSATLTYSVIVAADAYGVTLSNVVTPPKNGVCDPSCESTLYTPHYTINKTSDPADGSTIHADEVVTYSLNVQNDSQAILTGATATDTLVDVLDNATLVEPLNPALTFDAVNSEITWTIPTLQPGESTTISYSVRVTALNVGKNLKNVVMPDASGDCINEMPTLSAVDEPVLSCTVEHRIIDIDMAIVTTHTDPLGQTAIDGSVPNKITYQLTVKNNGPTIGLDDSTGVVVEDPMLAKLILDPATTVAPGWDVSQSTSTKLVAKYVANSGVFLANETAVITFVATIIPPVAPGGVVPVPGLDNQACVAAEQPEQNLANNCSADAVNVKWVALDPLGACRNGIPYMDYAVPLFDLNADGKKPTIALIWWKNGDYKGQDQLVDVNDTAAMFASGAQRVDYVTTPSDWVAGDIVKGTVLWPGAVLDANGAPIDWPGMSQHSDDSWYFDPTAPFYEIRKAATVEVRITNSSTSTYVPVDGAAIAACHPDTGELAHTGFPTTPLPIQAGLLFAGLATLAFAIRRRNYSK